MSGFLTPLIAVQPKKEISMMMESFHKDVVESVDDMLLNLFTRAGAPYQFKATHAWAWPMKYTKGIPTALCLN